MKKLLTLLGLCTLYLFVTACSNKSGDNKEISYRNHSNSPETPSQSSPTTLPQVEETSSTLDYLSDFKGIKSDYKTPSCGNLSINFKNESKLCLVCPDTENGITYYVNYGKDNYIYQLKDKKNTLLVKKKANYLQIWNNELYFLQDSSEVDNTDSFCYPQNIYKYNLDTGELSLVLDVSANWLYVNAEGIFYTEVKINEENLTELITGYHLAFDSDTPEKTGYTNFIPYKEYKLIYGSSGELVLHNTLTNQTYQMTSDYITNNQASISDNNFYYIHRGKLCSLNLNTSKKVDYDVLHLGDRVKDIPVISSYCELNGTMYVTVWGSTLYMIDINRGTISEMNVNGYGLLDLYTNGDKLFALAKYIPDLDEKDKKERTMMVELIVTENEITAEELTK